LLALPLLIFLLLPLAALVVRMDWFRIWETLLSSGVTQALRISMVTTLITTLLSILLGTPLAYVLARRQFRGRTIIDSLIDLPIVLPPSVAGIALLIAFGRRGLIGAPLAELGISLSFAGIAVIMAQCFVAAPYFVKAATAGFGGVDRELEIGWFAAQIHRVDTVRSSAQPGILPSEDR
jgi:molybdate transport system permease protein